MNTKTYRQGDVLLIPVAEIPAGKVKTKKIVLALGEATGHHHSIFGGGAVGFADDEEALAEFVQVEQEVEVEHQEHDNIKLPPGKYRSAIQHEYTPEALKKVVD